MDRLVLMVAERAEISEEQARWAVHTVTAFLKEKLPEDVAERLDDIVRGDLNLAADGQHSHGLLARLIGR